MWGRAIKIGESEFQSILNTSNFSAGHSNSSLSEMFLKSLWPPPSITTTTMIRMTIQHSIGHLPVQALFGTRRLHQ